MAQPTATSTQEASPPAPRRASFWAHRGLIALAVGSVVLEVALMWALGLGPSLGLAPQVAAPAPYGVFHDVRWLLVYHRSWPAFALEGIAVLAARSLLTASFVRAAWPSESSRPGMRG